MPAPQPFKIVWRWEYPDCGHGPYWKAWRWEEWTDNPHKAPSSEALKGAKHLLKMFHRHCETHPNPISEGLGSVRVDDRCGFLTKTQMNRWFTKANQAALKAVGLELVAYKVPTNRIRIGKRQVVFDIDYATKVTP